MSKSQIFITKKKAIYTDKISESDTHRYPTYLYQIPEFFKGIDKMKTPSGNMAEMIFDPETKKELKEIASKPGKNGFFVGAGAAQWAGASRGTQDYLKEEPCNKIPVLSIVNIAVGKLANTLGFNDYRATDATACISSLKALQDAIIMIELGYIERAIVFGWDDQINNATLNVFGATKASLTKKLYDSGVKPSAFDETNGGFFIGHGLGYVLIEGKKSLKQTHSKKLAKVISTFVGAEVSSNPLSLSSDGYYNTMSECLKRSNLKKGNISFIKAHGSGTKRNNEEESKAIEELFGKKVKVTSYKPEIGHTMGASGILELIIALNDLEKNKIRGIKNRTVKDKRYLSKDIKANGVKYFMCNSSGMGNVFASAIIERM